MPCNPHPGAALTGRNDQERAMERLSLFWFGVTAAMLMALASALALFGVYAAASALLPAHTRTGEELLTSVGYIIIAIAIFEVAKYILEEEVIRARELRHVSEVRRSMTRFVSTIIIVVFLEGIVAVFKVTLDDMQQLVYPALLILVGVAMLTGLGVFQRLAATVERDIGAHDDMEEGSSSRRGSARQEDAGA